MSDDIVAQLRAMMQGCENPNCEGCEVEAEAADEIERLRTELKRWQDCEMVVESLCGWDSEETYCDKCKEAYEEMMTNE